MSNRRDPKSMGGTMTASLAGQGQRAVALEMEFGDFNPNEQAVLCALSRGPAMTIKEIMVANGWQSLENGKGNSRVRNSVRKPVRAGWVEHVTQVGDGRYYLTAHGRRYFDSEPSVALAVEPCPLQLSDEEARVISHDVEAATKVKKPECTFYNACLAQAVSGKWAGFSCKGCGAYDEPDAHQKMMNLVRLRALDMAATLLEETGSPCRVRGVKPGADAKRTERVEMVPLSEALKEE